LNEALETQEQDMTHLDAMRDRLIDGLSQIPHSRLNGDRERRVPGTVNFCFEGIEGESLLLLLDDRGIAASSGSACTSGSLDPSHVLLALGLPHEVAHGSLRLSFSADVTAEQIDYIIASVTEVVAYLRNMSPVWDELERGILPHQI
ncbi:MAG: aminotransferase class V-fold PLP-dependent enzyme, partial [Oscillospiraceae bacterium]|nr:aminotransferase class V-fold PLP-dependent enzyme [Oscillospiraceae bacterium]